MRLLIAICGVAAALAIAGCGSTSKPSTTSSYKPPAAKVSPACETAREELQSEEGPNPPGNGKYLTEDRELVQEECGAAARRRWARIKHEETPEGKEERAEEVAQNIERAKEQAAERCAGLSEAECTAKSKREFQEGWNEAAETEQREREERPSGESKWEELRNQR